MNKLSIEGEPGRGGGAAEKNEQTKISMKPDD